MRGLSHWAVATALAFGLAAAQAGPQGIAPGDEVKPWLLKKYQSTEIEEKNSDSDLARGFITYGMLDPKRVDGHLVAFIYLRWGDVDDKLKGRGAENYSNWSGSVTLDGGRVTLLSKNFHDGRSRDGKTDKAKEKRVAELYSKRRKMRDQADKTYEQRKKRIERRYKENSERRNKLKDLDEWRHKRYEDIDEQLRKSYGDFVERRTPKEGTARDAVLAKRTIGQVAWQSGVTGEVNTVLLQLDVDRMPATGEIKIGKFTVPFVVTPLPNDFEGRRKRGKKADNAAPDAADVEGRE